MRFSAATHFFENVREQNILPRLVRLPRDSAALCSICFVEPILAQSHQDDEPQCFSVVHIQPARAPQCRIRKIGIAFLGVQAAQGERRAIMPPICAREIFDQALGRIGSVRFTQDFRLEADQFPNVRVIFSRSLENGEGRTVVVCTVPHAGEV